MPRILIVDDEPDMRGLLVEILDWSGFEVLETGCGEEAIESAAENRPDIIILDVMLPDVQGWEVMERIRESEDSDSIPIIFMSGSTMAKTKYQRCLPINTTFLMKPFEIKDLVEQVGRALSLLDKKRQPTKNRRVAGIIAMGQ